MSGTSGTTTGETLTHEPRCVLRIGITYWSLYFTGPMRGIRGFMLAVGKSKPGQTDSSIYGLEAITSPRSLRSLVLFKKFCGTQKLQWEYSLIPAPSPKRS